MKKKLLLTFLTICILSCSKPKEGFTIKANINGLKDSTMVYLFNGDTWNMIDSTIVLNNEFEFAGKLNDPVPISFIVKEHEIYPDFWLENKEIEINASIEPLSEKDINFNKLSIGSKTNEVALRYKELTDPIHDNTGREYQKISKKIITKEEFDTYADKNFDTIKKVSLQFFLENPNNYFSIYEILNFRKVFPKESSQEYFNLLSDKMKNSSYGKKLDTFLSTKPLEEGDDFVDIVAENLKGETIKLSDYKGKVILLDFWAGWCVPCVKQIKEEFPTIIEKYKNENFQIVSFSFDVERSRWENASKKLQLSWPDFSNLLRMGSNPVALNYSLEQIPTSFIISEEGKILKRVEYEDNLEEELDKVFNIKE